MEFSTLDPSPQVIPESGGIIERDKELKRVGLIVPLIVFQKPKNEWVEQFVT